MSDPVISPFSLSKIIRLLTVFFETPSSFARSERFARAFAWIALIMAASRDVILKLVHQFYLISHKLTYLNFDLKSK
jgi:hypothetical protein